MTAPDQPTPSARRSRRGLLVFLLALAAAIGLVAVFARRGADPAGTMAGMEGMEGMAGHGAPAGGDSLQPVRLAPADVRRIGVTFAEATRTSLGQPVRAAAEVRYDETTVTTVTLKVDGWVERLYVDFTGRTVRRGEPLLDLYSPMLVTAQQELVLARALGDDVRTGTDDARRGAGELAEAARRRLRYWDVPEEAIARVERTGEPSRTVTLRAPAGGVVLDKPVVQGQRVMAGEPLLRLADLSRVWVEGDVFERDLPAVRMGQTATVEFQALPGETRTGRIAYVYPVMDPATRTARVRVELANPGMTLKPGMYATLRFTPAGDSVLTVPRAAVLVTGERTLVFLKRPGGTFEPRLVVLGRTTEDRAEILQGLAAGDSVVASGTFLVDAESNLGTVMGGMGDMPGMPIRAPGDSTGRPAPTPRTDSGHGGH